MRLRRPDKAIFAPPPPRPPGPVTVIRVLPNGEEDRLTINDPPAHFQVDWINRIAVAAEPLADGARRRGYRRAGSSLPSAASPSARP
jgi:hypothetical protein